MIYLPLFEGLGCGWRWGRRWWRGKETVQQPFDHDVAWLMTRQQMPRLTACRFEMPNTGYLVYLIAHCMDIESGYLE